MKAYAYRLLRNSAEALILLPFIMVMVPVTTIVFGINIGQMLLSFAFLPAAITLGVLTQGIKNKLVRALLFLPSLGAPFLFAYLLHFGELATGFAFILYFAFFVKQIIWPRYYVPGMRLAPLCVFAFVAYIVDIAMFLTSREFTAYANVIIICAVATFFVSLTAIYFEQIMLTGWYAKQRIPIDRSVKRRNIVYMTVCAGMMLILSSLGNIYAAIGHFYDFVLRAILSSTGLLFSLLGAIRVQDVQNHPKPIEVASVEQSGGMISGAEAITQNEMILNLLKLLAVVLIAFTIYFLFKFIRNLFEQAFKGMHHLLVKANKDDGITDEEEILTKDEVKNNAPEVLKSLWHSLTSHEIYRRLDSNAKKARFIYRRVYKRFGLKHLPKTTPREVCAELRSISEDKQTVDNLRLAYEKARYGDREPSNEEINSIEKLL